MITATQIKALFNEYNTKYFDGIIKPIEIILKARKTRGRCGFFSYRWFIVIYPNNALMQGENDIKETLIHEMTHAYLFQRFGKGNCGHNGIFKAKLANILRQEFQGIKLGNVRFKQTLTPTKEIPVETFLPLLKMIRTQEPVASVAVMTNRYKVISTGKIGTFVRESMVYGRKHISLQIEGMLFPFTTNMDNVIPA